MPDDPRQPTPSAGLVPDPDDETNIDRLNSDTPDSFDEELEDEELEDEELTGDDLGDERSSGGPPQEEVYPGDSEFKQELEDDESDRYGEAG